MAKARVLIGKSSEPSDREGGRSVSAAKRGKNAGKAVRLPQLLQDIADVTDIDAALAVAKAKGGQIAYFSPNPGPGTWLVKAVGRAKALRIGKALCASNGAALLIPIGPAITEARRLKIESLLLAGNSTAKTAAILNLHSRTVQMHRSRLQKLGLQKGGAAASASREAGS